MKRRPTEQELMEIAQRNGWPLKMVEDLVRDSAISEHVLIDARVGVVDDPKAAAKRFGKPAKEWKEKERLPTWFVPYFIPFHRDPVTERAKVSPPFITKEKKEDGTTTEKVQKYAQAHNSGVHVLFGPSLLRDNGALSDATKPVVIAEGEKKTLACESAGVSCIGLGGVHSWHLKGQKTLHPELLSIEWDGRIVYIAFDFDALYNAKVRDQEIALGRVLEARGAKVYVIRFTPDAPKLDDFLATHDVSEFHKLMEEAREHGALPPDTVGAVGAPADATALTDLGNAERMVKQHGNDLRYCEAIGAWYLWTGKRWERDTTQQVIRRAMATARSIYSEADAATDPDARALIRQHAKTSEAQARLNAMVKLTSVMKSISVKPEAFDKDPWLINCENGTVDLRTGELHTHRREDLITRVAPVRFDPEAKHELWTRFLYEATGGDVDMIAYLQRAVGYSLTGSTREDKLFFIYGPGGRGKGTFVNAILAPLGEYARVADISSFLERRDPGGDKPRPDLVRLMGSRIALCDEVKRDARLDEGLVKTITGGSPLSVRTLNKEGFELVPTFHLWLVANDPPIINAEDTGMWRRMVRIPFVHAPATPDTQLRDTLKSDPAVRAAVFAWAVQGVQRWLADGLREPQAILDSNAAYHAEMDPVGEFFAMNCLFREIEYGEAVKISRKELRSAYEGWCKDEGHQPCGARRFSARLKDAMRAHGFDPKDARTTVWIPAAEKGESKVRDGWKFVRLLTDQERRDRDAAVQQGVGDGELVTNIVPLVNRSPIAQLHDHTKHETPIAACSNSVTRSLEVTRSESKEVEAQQDLGLVTSASADSAKSLPDSSSPLGRSDSAGPDNDNAKPSTRRRL